MKAEQNSRPGWGSAPLYALRATSVPRYVLGLVLAGMNVAGPALASQQAQSGADAQSLIESFVRSQMGPAYRVELRFDQLGAGMRLAPCKRVEPFLSRGARLWGRTTIGVRCIDGAHWSVAVPMTVAVFGPALVASRPLAANTPISEGDVHVQEVELSRENRPALTEISQISGTMSTRSIPAGQAFRDYHVRIMPTVRPGDPVRIRVVGKGFVVVSDGAAMASAGEGQPVRVRTSSGKIMLGTVNGRSVDVRL